MWTEVSSVLVVPWEADSEKGIFFSNEENGEIAKL